MAVAVTCSQNTAEMRRPARFDFAALLRSDVAAVVAGVHFAENHSSVAAGAAAGAAVVMAAATFAAAAAAAGIGSWGGGTGHNGPGNPSPVVQLTGQ